MNSEFPDPEDDYDLMHEDEYEVLRELEEIENQNNREVQNQHAKNVPAQPNEFIKKSVSRNLFQKSDEVSEELPIIQKTQSVLNLENVKKRSIDQISKDNNLLESLDLTNFDDDYFQSHEKKRPCWDKPEELIQLIIERRKNLHNHSRENNLGSSVSKKDQTKFISRRVPLYNFIALTRCDDGERLYIKVSDKNKELPIKIHRPTSSSLLKSFNQLKDEAEQIILNNIEKASLPPLEPLNETHSSCELWVDKYRPKRYIELLSDENINRSLLHWLKLWDKIVFDRDPTVRSRKIQSFPKLKNKFNKKEEIPDYDSKGFPSQRIALLTGPPGLGKTTLAHVAVRHAGYNIVELNASDDRGPDAFREALTASTQMRALIDQDKRPNCLVLDEIDGAPSASIELLLKFIHGKLTPKGRNVKEKPNKENGCRRPIICICNDLYTPSLRPLRSMALVITVPEISPEALAERLAEITQNEGLHVDSRVLLRLAETSGCDIRTCLGILQYTGGGADMLKNLSLGMKDTRKGLFDSWRQMLQLPINRRGVLPASERVQRIISLVHQSEPDRLAQGVFHNYPQTCKDNIVQVYKSLQWFQFYDEVNRLVMERQVWNLMPYTNSAFVTWHLCLAGSQNPKLSYPTTTFEVHQKVERNTAILAVTKKTCKLDVMTLVSEVLPYLPDLLCPRLRSVNVQLYSSKEKSELERLVDLMLYFGLTFTQEKRADGGYDYVLDPNIWDIATFENCKVRKPLSYPVKQIVVHELETTRLQRAAINSGPLNESSKEPNAKSAATKQVSNDKEVELTPSQSALEGQKNLPNHLRQLNPVQIEPRSEKKSRNFFQAFQLIGMEKAKKQREKDKEQGIVSPQHDAKAELAKHMKEKTNLLKSDVWYQYKEGYSNAVRRTILMSDLIPKVYT